MLATGIGPKLPVVLVAANVAFEETRMVVARKEALRFLF